MANSSGNASHSPPISQPNRRSKRAVSSEMSSATPADTAAISELATVRDYVRYAVSRFTAAQLFFGHGSDNAWDEADGRHYFWWGVGVGMDDCRGWVSVR